MAIGKIFTWYIFNLFFIFIIFFFSSVRCCLRLVFFPALFVRGRCYLHAISCIMRSAIISIAKNIPDNAYVYGHHMVLQMDFHGAHTHYTRTHVRASQRRLTDDDIELRKLYNAKYSNARALSSIHMAKYSIAWRLFSFILVLQQKDVHVKQPSLCLFFFTYLYECQNSASIYTKVEENQKEDNNNNNKNQRTSTRAAQ